MPATKDSVRLEVRLDPEHKDRIETAASLLGISVSAFTTSTLLREAEAVAQQYGNQQLSSDDRDGFLSALDRAAKANAKVKKAAKQHSKKVK